MGISATDVQTEKRHTRKLKAMPLMAKHEHDVQWIVLDVQNDVQKSRGFSWNEMEQSGR